MICSGLPPCASIFILAMVAIVRFCSNPTVWIGVRAETISPAFEYGLKMPLGFNPKPICVIRRTTLSGV